MSRSEAELRADIADIERLMVDVPPHHGAGTRRSLEERLDDLRTELRQLEREGRGGVGPAGRAG